MQPVSNDTLLRQLEWRYATKKFDAQRKIPAADWETLERALALTPSSYGLQPWKFVVVVDQPTKEKLVPASWKQTQPAEASHMVVFAIRQNLSEADIDRYIQRITEVRGGSVEALAGFRKMMVGSLLGANAQLDINEWATRQVYIALGNFMTVAALLGIDTCPMEGIVPKQYDEILKLQSTGYATSVACAAGYRASDDKYATIPKVRFDVEDVVLRI